MAHIVNNTTVVLVICNMTNKTDYDATTINLME